MRSHVSHKDVGGCQCSGWWKAFYKLLQHGRGEVCEDKLGVAGGCFYHIYEAFSVQTLGYECAWRAKGCTVREQLQLMQSTVCCLLGVWASAAPYGTSPTCLNPVPSHTHAVMLQWVSGRFTSTLVSKAGLKAPCGDAPVKGMTCIPSLAHPPYPDYPPPGIFTEHMYCQSIC